MLADRIKKMAEQKKNIVHEPIEPEDNLSGSLSHNNEPNI